MIGKLLKSLHTSNNSFEGQEQDEKVLMVVRRHPIFVLIQTIITISVALVMIIPGLWFASQLMEHDLFGLYSLATMLVGILLWQALFYAYMMYMLDIWVITDRRIVDSRQEGFFGRTVSELHIARIQDISVEVEGVLQTFFGFGDVSVQTAGTTERFRFVQVANPHSIKDTIMHLADAHLQPSTSPRVYA